MIHAKKQTIHKRKNNLLYKIIWQENLKKTTSRQLFAEICFN